MSSSNGSCKDVEPLFTHPEQHIGTFVTIGVILLLIVLVFSILAALVRYPAETAVMRMVDEYETTAAASWASARAGNWAGTGGLSACG